MPAHTMLRRHNAHTAPVGIARHTYKNAKNRRKGDGAHMFWTGGLEMRRMCITEAWCRKYTLVYSSSRFAAATATCAPAMVALAAECAGNMGLRKRDNRTYRDAW